MNKRLFLITLLFFQTAKLKADNYAPVVRIENPKTGSNFKIDEEITFKGRATDLEDGELSGKGLVWTSDMDGLIGQGSSFSTKLSEGSHIVILTATDLEGSSGRASIFIIVGTPKVIEPIDEVEIEPEKPKPEKSKIEKQLIPSIVFLFVPPFGSFENLQGRVLNADSNEFAVAVYIMVDGVWWSKPVIKINKDGKWVCDITTVENDELAIKIAAYLIPADYKPPTASGDFWILKEIEEKCLAKIEVTRKIRPEAALEAKGKPEIKKKSPKESVIARESRKPAGIFIDLILIARHPIDDFEKHPDVYKTYMEKREKLGYVFIPIKKDGKIIGYGEYFPEKSIKQETRLSQLKEDLRREKEALESILKDEVLVKQEARLFQLKEILKRAEETLKINKQQLEELKKRKETENE